MRAALESLPRARWVALLMVLLAGGFASRLAPAARAVEASARRGFDVPSDWAEQSLKLFSQQSGRGVIAGAEIVRAVRTNAVRGELTAQEALAQMLRGTGLVATEDEKSGAFAVRRETSDPNGGRAAQKSDRPRSPEPPALAREISPKETMKSKNPVAVLVGWLALAIAPHHATQGAENAAGGASVAPAGLLEGRVQNAVSGGYLNNARVSIAGTNRVVLSDQSGAYQIPDVPAGSVKVRVSYTGLEPQEVTIEMAPGAVVRRDFSLAHPTTVQLEKFTVVATREQDAMALAINEQRYASNIKTVVAADAFGDISEGNVGEFLKLMPGITVNTNNDDAFDISVRGFNPEFTPVTMDGNDVANARANISSSLGGVKRGGGNFEDISMSNLSRVEVIKSPVPSMSADFMGGSVNLVTRSAFERRTAELKVSGTLQFSSLDHSLEKTHGPGGQMTRKIRPGYDFSYVKPITENFGVTVSAGYSEQYRRIIAPTPTYEFAPAQGGSERSPYLRGFLVREDGRVPIRQSFAFGADWRPFNAMTLQFRYRYNLYDLHTAATRLNVNTGNNPASFGADFTQGRVGGAAISHSNIEADGFGPTNELSLAGRYQKNWWKSDFSVMYSDSGRKYRDTEHGYFQTAVTSIPTGTVRFSNYDGQNMPTLDVRDATGAAIDWKRLNNYRITEVRANNRDAKDKVSSAKLNLRRDFDLLGNRAGLQIGGAYRERIADMREVASTWTYLGPDRVANNADNNAGPFRDEHAQVGPKFGVPTEIEFPSNFLLYDRYRTNPEQFVFNESANFTSRINGSERIVEEITAGYVQGELKLMDNRLAIVGGVRLERTQNTGFGALRDREAAYQHDASGRLIRNASGSPILITSDALARAKLEYTERGARNSRSYSDYYPSVNLTYELKSNLLLRLGYARTLGRPDYKNILPTRDVIEDLAEDDGSVGRISARNPALKPWEADNYDLSLEYYLPSSGVVSVGAFRKNVVNGFGADTRVLDEKLLEEFDLDKIYLGWDLVGTFNVGDPVRINGVELNYQQRLSFLPMNWAKGFSVFANTTFLNISGPETDFSSLVKHSASWGFRYSYRRVALGLNWTYRTSRSTERLQVGPQGVTYFPSRMTLDATSEFRITPKIGLFLNVRNLNDEWSARSKQFSPVTPDYIPYSSTYTGLKFALGVRGTF